MLGHPFYISLQTATGAPLQLQNFSAVQRSACSGSGITARGPSSACRGSLSGVQCSVSPVCIRVRKGQHLWVKASFEHKRPITQFYLNKLNFLTPSVYLGYLMIPLFKCV